ncbi:flagellar biosynthesis protein FlhF [Paenibacillus assamensis]|uniref:flagellar biosynthesis protein FlhF n=1 Tax=Paenibacillus assamensis TaxID=311244 RepID=UPI0003F769E1|nr:flagellar biosynthesis protein FlhF [Paenibacillus assamensis]
MRVKKYIVETMPEAMSQIRQELGKDAVIVSTKEIKSGGFLGFFAKQKIEVTAAVDEQPASVPAREMASARPSVPSSVARNAYVGRNQATSYPSERVQQKPARQDELPVKEVQSTSFTPSDRIGQQEVAASSTSSKPSVSAVVNEASEASLQHELQEMKAMVKSMLRHTEHERWPDTVRQLEKYLLEQGVFSEYAYDLAKQSMDRCIQLGINEPDVEMLKREASSVLSELFMRNVKEGIAANTRVIYFVGPTGVGKTTTIAKLAADQMFHHNRKVGFVTSDTYRIAAVEQLRTYASILNSPLEVVTSPNDLQRAILALEDCNLILMDTAGRNYRNDMFVNEMRSLLKPLEGSESVLVLSLTSKSDDMMAIVKQFQANKLDRIIFTKADETVTYGAYVNVAMRTKVPFSYITYGQNVPDDIRAFSPSEAAEQLLGEF